MSPSMAPRMPSPFVLGICAVGMMVPVTLPVTVLRGMVQERFEVSVLWTSVFMSINMVGAVLAAPVAGALADRIGRYKSLIVGAMIIDAALLFALTLDLPFWVFLTIRFAEGCAHITALSLLLSMAASLGNLVGKGRIMGIVGGCITFGVALGAPLGGLLGRDDPLYPIRVGAVISFSVALIAWLFLAGLSGCSQRPRWSDIVAMARKETALLLPFAYSFVDRFTVGFFTTTFALWMREVHDLSPARIGMLLALFLGPFSLLSYPFGRLSERVSRTLLVAGGSLIYGLGVMSLGLWSPDALPAVMFALGVASAVMFVPSLILATDLASPEIRSTALGGFNAAGSLGFIFGPLVGGVVSQTVAAASDWNTGYATAFVVAGFSQILCVSITLPALRRLVRERRTT